MRWKRRLAALLTGVCLAVGLQAGPATAIVGGREATPDRHYFMAGLVDTYQKKVVCGATLISPRYVLTAASCLGGRNAGGMGVLLGDHDYGTATESGFHQDFIPVEDFIVHENYDLRTMANDIALVRLLEEVRPNLKVDVAYLPWEYLYQDWAHAPVTALGWGATQTFDGPVSTVLQSVDLVMMANAECVNRGMENLTSGSICNYTPGKGTCTFDDGGPVIYDAGYPLLVGIISYGEGCGSGSPDVNTRVSSYLQWILQKTPDATYQLRGSWPPRR
ncbi:serine protease [Streptomyces sp. SM11]|uniref:S1 family serine peptidase n=1 Tax=Streptomyces sp. SM11 TaxID=565557 RepID=UPI000CD55DC3|nr:serine protease [Streptomyces sp. SM11]